MDRIWRVTVWVCLGIVILQSKDPGKGERPVRVAGVPAATVLNINAMSSWYSNNGNQEQNPETENGGLTYPRGTSTAIFAS